MWKSAVKFLVIMLLKNRIQFIKNKYFNKLNINQRLNRTSSSYANGLHAGETPETYNDEPSNTNPQPDEFKQLKHNLALMAESRASFFKQNFSHEVQRVVSSLLGFMVMLVAAVFAGLVGIMWIFAIAWTSPNRELILGITMLVPIIAAVIIFITIKNSWKKEPLLAQSMKQVENDWLVFRGGLDGTADTSDAANY